MVAPAYYGEGVYGESFYGYPALVTPFSGGGITMDVELWRATIDNELVEHLTESDPVDGQITMNLDRAIKLNGSFTITHPERVRPYLDYLAPFLTMEFDDGRPSIRKQLGLYTVRVPPATVSIDDAKATFEGDDLTRLLAESAYSAPDEVASGSVIRTEVISTIAEAGISRVSIPATTRVTGYDRSYPPGTTRLEKCNRLTDRMLMYDLYTDLDGRIATQKLTSKRTIEPYRTITDEDLLADIEVQPSDTQIANVVIVVKDNPSEAPIIGVARNDDPASPTSTVAIGRDITRVEQVLEIEDQADADAMAARLLEEGRSVYRTAKITTFPTEALGIHQTVELALTGRWADLNGRWGVRTWTLGFSPSTLALVQDINQYTLFDGTVV